MRNWNLERSTRHFQQSQNRQLAILEDTTDLVATVDIDGFLISLNNPGIELLGLDFEQENNITTLRLASFYTSQSIKNLSILEFPNAVKNNVCLSETVIRSNSGEEIPCSQSLIAHKDDFGNVTFFSVILRDIRPIKAAEKERLELINQLHQAKKMETIGRLAGGVAHDFNNILTVIIGYSELGLSSKDVNPHNKEMYERILNSSEKAARLSNQLLDFSSKQIIEPKILNLNEIIKDSQNLIERLMGEEIEITTSLDRFLWPVKIDRSQLEQIILNLAVNARDALASNGRFSITTENISLTEEQAIEISQTKNDEFVLLTVNDTGSGISAEVIPHIFEPFYTTKKSGEGTGLGLSAAYGAIKQNNGHITVESEPSFGTTFKIFLPRIIQKTPLIQPETTNAIQAPPKGHEKILLVEDNPEVRSLLVRVLANLDYIVVEAKNSDEAIEIFNSNPEAISLVISDIVMPKMDGLELTKVFQETNPNIKVLLISGHTERIAAIQNLNNDSIKLLTKPFPTQQLAKEVRTLLDKT